MSHNLHLKEDKSNESCDLIQTPTSLTERAMQSCDPKSVYFGWLDGLVGPKPLPPRNPSHKSMSVYRDRLREWQEHHDEMEDRKKRVLDFLGKHPMAYWYSM